MLPKTPDKASCAVRVCDKALSPRNTAADISTPLLKMRGRRDGEREREIAYDI
jgi:hypothetical protein